MLKRGTMRSIRKYLFIAAIYVAVIYVLCLVGIAADPAIYPEDPVRVQNSADLEPS